MALKPRKPAIPVKGGGPVKRRNAVDKEARPAGVTGKADVRIFMSYSHHDVAAQVRLTRTWRRGGATA